MKKLIFLLLVLTTTSAYATLLIEPYIGHPVNSSAISTTPSGETEYEIESKNFIIGSRVALSMLGFFAGVDYKMFTIEGNEGDDLSSDVYQKGRTAIVAGYNFPIFLRAWVSIAQESEFETSGQSNGEMTDYVYNNDEDITFGIGYTGLPLLSVNFELSQIHSNYFKVGEGKQDVDLDWTIYSVSLSLPIDL